MKMVENEDNAVGPAVVFQSVDPGPLNTLLVF